MEEPLRDRDEDLAFDIGLGLMRTPLKPPKPKRLELRNSFDWHKSAGQTVVEHLKRSGWVFTRKPPQPMHGSAYNPPHPED